MGVPVYQLRQMPISIHAPREGGDGEMTFKQAATLLFQSTPPARGATLHWMCLNIRRLVFQSTPPARGATRLVV